MVEVRLKDLLEYEDELERLTFGFRNFLDIFYENKDVVKEELVREEPSEYALDVNEKEKITIIAAFHFLCSWFWLDVPKWMLNEKYVLPEPYYPAVKSKSSIDLAIRVSKPETKYHNVFVDIGSLVTRV